MIVDVQSRDPGPDLFKLKARHTCLEIEVEGQRGIDWITVDRAAFWKAEMRRAADGVNQAIKDLEHCRTYKKVGDNAPACAEEKKILKKPEKNCNEQKRNTNS